MFVYGSNNSTQSRRPRINPRGIAGEKRKALGNGPENCMIYAAAAMLCLFFCLTPFVHYSETRSVHSRICCCVMQKPPFSG